MLFSSLSYIFYYSDIKIYTPFNPKNKWSHHFQITNPLPVEFDKKFIFLGYVDQLDYLNNKYTINLIDIKNVPFIKIPIKIYEVIF